MVDGSLGLLNDVVGGIGDLMGKLADNALDALKFGHLTAGGAAAHGLND